MDAGSRTPGFEFSVRVDDRRNIVYLTQAGAAQAADMRRMMAEYEQALQQVRPGFVLINDQRKVTEFTDEAMEIGARLVTLTGDRGVGHVIRLNPEAAAMRVRISRVLITARAPYMTEYATTPDEAEAKASVHLASRSAH